MACHPVLFTGAVVQEVLEARGIVYTLFSTAMFDRVWFQYRTADEANWEPYVQGKIGIDEAIAGMLTMLDGKD